MNIVNELATRSNELFTLAQQVATHLPGKWEATKHSEDSWYVTLQGEGTASLHVGTEWNKKDRLTISGNYPYAPNGGGDYTRYADKERKPRITVAKARGAEIIAREITRRVLPVYLEILAGALDSKAQHEAAQNKQRETAQRICDALGKPNPFKAKPESYSRAYHNIHLDTDRDLDGFSYGSVEVQEGGSVTLTLHSVDAAKVLRILEVLKKAKRVQQ